MSDATNGVLASVVSLREKGIEPLGGQTDEIADRIETASGQVEQAEGKFNTYGISLGDVNALNKVFGVTQDQVNQSLDDGTVAFDSAGASAEEFGDTLDQVQSSGGFFEGIKQGFKDFVANVESNSELMADFFADTLSQMSQNFSDLFFNVITGKFDDLQDLAKQAHRSGQLDLRAPSAGVIKDLATHSAGTVVAPGTILATIVPRNEPLEAEVWVSNLDAGHVAPGAAVKLKLAAFPYQRHGMLEGIVRHVSADATERPEPGSQGGVGLYYRALVAIDPVPAGDGLDPRRLASGMQLAAEIHLGTRTVFEYLLSPVRRTLSEAGRES